MSLQCEPATTIADVDEAISHARADQRRCGRAVRRYLELEAEIERLWDMRTLVLLEADLAP